MKRIPDSKAGRCDECGDGVYRRTVVSRFYRLSELGDSVRVPGLISYRCDRCGAVAMPISEFERGREIAQLLLDRRRAKVA
jgi:hypothetical protein